MSDFGPGSMASLNGEIMPVHEATIPVSDEGLIRGDGAFEVMRVYDGVPYAFDAHLARLQRTGANIRLELDLRRSEPSHIGCWRRLGRDRTHSCFGSW